MRVQLYNNLNCVMDHEEDDDGGMTSPTNTSSPANVPRQFANRSFPNRPMMVPSSSMGMRSQKGEFHPQRQSTPRRKLREAQLAAKMLDVEKEKQQNYDTESKQTTSYERDNKLGDTSPSPSRARSKLAVEQFSKDMHSMAESAVTHGTQKLYDSCDSGSDCMSDK